MATAVVSTEGPLDFARGKLRPEWRDLLSTKSRLSRKEGLSAPRFALRSRRRQLPYAIALPWRGRGLVRGRDGTAIQAFTSRLFVEHPMTHLTQPPPRCAGGEEHEGRATGWSLMLRKTMI